MSDEASEAVAGSDKDLVDTVEHRVGYAIFRVLTERPASARELAALLSQPRSTVGDQLRKLIAGGLVESAGEEARRGATERFYRVAPGSRWLDDEATGKLTPDRSVGPHSALSVRPWLTPPWPSAATGSTTATIGVWVPAG